jgi:hypothetical protein
MMADPAKISESTMKAAIRELMVVVAVLLRLLVTGRLWSGTLLVDIPRCLGISLPVLGIVGRQIAGCLGPDDGEHERQNRYS